MKRFCYIQAIVLIGLFVSSSCNQNPILKNNGDQTFILWSGDTALHLVNGVLFYKGGDPFNGEIKESWQNKNVKSVQCITNGKQQGLSQTFYQDGSRESIRWYNRGEKDSVHTGWWENGNKKYEYHFKDGLYDGLFTEWYQSGKMIQQLMYSNGKELYGKGWRETGKLYMNFVMKNGRRYGLNNSNLCYGLKKEMVSD